LNNKLGLRKIKLYTKNNAFFYTLYIMASFILKLNICVPTAFQTIAATPPPPPITIITTKA
jgi:hypothetical protein